MTTDSSNPAPAVRSPAWQPLLVALLPALAAHAAFLLSVRDGWVPACLPYWEGCTSISRAARHGQGNLLFKAVMLPCAGLLAWLWWSARARLARRGRGGGTAIALLGTVGAVALATYVAHLGADGDFARWLRRYGALAYFAATFLAQFLYVRASWRAGERDATTRGLLLLCVVLLALGLASTWASGTVADAALKDRIENAIEWTLGALFSAWFALLALHWRQPR